MIDGRDTSGSISRRSSTSASAPFAMRDVRETVLIARQQARRRAEAGPHMACLASTYFEMTSPAGQHDSAPASRAPGIDEGQLHAVTNAQASPPLTRSDELS
jgi:hypothetical protein